MSRTNWKVCIKLLEKGDIIEMMVSEADELVRQGKAIFVPRKVFREKAAKAAAKPAATGE